MKHPNTAQSIVIGALALLAAGSAMGQADNTNSRTAPAGTFSAWMYDQSKTQNGYITRDQYMQEAGRRWDIADKNRKGLTVDQVNSVYGYGSAASITKTPDKIEGNMAPAVTGPTK